MLTESFLNSCFTLVLNKEISPKGMEGAYRDISDILAFYKKKEKNEIPIVLKNKVDCLEEICELKKEGRTSDNVLDSIVSYSNKFKDLEPFLDIKLNEQIDHDTFIDNLQQIKIRKKMMALFANYDKISDFLETVKSGAFNSSDSVTVEFESFVKDLYSNLMKIKRDESVEGSATLDLTEDDYDSVISLIKSKYHEELTGTGYKELDRIMKGGLQKGRLYIIAGGSGCVDKDTEFFNGYEWKKISEWTENDLVLQYNEDGSASLVKPIRYIKNDCDEFNYIETRGLDMMFCDEHNHIYVNRNNPKKLQKISTRELLERHNKNSHGFGGNFISSFNYGSSGIELSDSEIRLSIAVIADGHFRSNSKLTRINLKKERKKERLVKLLTDCGIEYRRKDIKTGFSVFYFYAPLNHKTFKPEYWYKCNNHQFKIICDEIFYWDGSENTFYTTDKDSADFIQFAFASIGKRASIRLDDRVHQKYKTSGKEYIRKSICYEVRLCNGNLLGLHTYSNEKKLNIKRFKSIDGKRYCFEVPSGMLVLRRNNKIFSTKNSGKSTLLTNIIVKGVEKSAEQIKEDPSKMKKNKQVYLYITLENLVDETLMRLYQAMFDKSYEDIIDLVLSDKNKEIRENITEKLNSVNSTIVLRYFPKFSITPTDISMIIDDVASVHGKENIKAVIIDYLDLLEVDRVKHKTYDLYRLELSKITSSLKDVAVEHNLPILTVTQLGREIYNKSFDPKTLNLGLMSEAIKKVEHADFIAMMVVDAKDKNKVYMFIGKNRGSESNIHLSATVDFSRFKFIDMKEDKNIDKTSTDSVTSEENAKNSKKKDEKFKVPSVWIC